MRILFEMDKKDYVPNGAFLADLLQELSLLRWKNSNGI